MIIGVVDIVGVLLIGLILARSVGSLGSSTTATKSKLSEYLAVFDNFTLLEIAAFATAAFISKSLFSAFLTKIMLDDLAQIEVSLAGKAFQYMLKNISWTIKTYSKSDINYLLKTSTSSAIQMLAAYVVMVSELFFLSAMFISFFIVDAKITLFIIVYFALIAVFLHNYLGKRFKAAGIKSVTNEISATTVIFDTIQSYREVVALKREAYFLEKFKNYKFNVAKASFDIQFLSALPRYILESSLLLGALGIISISLRSGNIQQSAESIGIFLTGSMKIMTSLLPLQTYFAQFKNQVEISQKFLDFEEQTKNNREVSNSNQSSGKTFSVNEPVGIEIKNLEFNYGDIANPVLKDINLKIEPGQFVAFIGPSGSGKSTLADLIIGINEPFLGEIDYFTKSLNKINGDNISFGYVPQNPGRIYGTIKENIGFGLDDIQDDLLAQAIDDAHLSDVVNNLESGFEFHTGEQSDDLSGGQMQRIGLARALYSKPNILLLDEATSALDVEIEAAVSKSLEKLRGSCTIVVIAHRLSTVKNADVVFVVDEGKILAHGKFAELVKTNDLVARFVELSNLPTN
jgi:ABC-type multidrug transport system fused ATPase/permease subunit